MSASTKDTFRRLTSLFSPPPEPTPTPSSTSSTPSSSSPPLPPNPFPGFTLPSEISDLVDSHTRTFASLPLPPSSRSTLTSTSTTSAAPSSSSTTSPLSSTQPQTERERERTLWRTSLSDLFRSSVEPSPGSERDLSSIGRVSAFLVLLDKLSAESGDDDDSAIVSRADIGGVWWKTVLRRTLLGTPREDSTAGGYGGPAGEKDKALGSQQQQRGRKPTRKGKEPATESPSSTATAGGTISNPPQPLYVSRAALAAATRTVVWGMAPRRDLADQVGGDEYVSPFGMVILNEYEDRALARLKGLDEGYGVRNLEECLMLWGETSPKAFFTRLSPFLTPTSPSVLPSTSLCLSYLSRHSTRAYHALSTPLVTNLITTALAAPCAAVVSLAVKCLAIFVVTLPVILGEDKLLGVFSVFARVVCWDKDVTTPDEDDGKAEAMTSEADLHNFYDTSYDDLPPDPFLLFTVLYGIYPCNFTSFIRDAAAYLREKGWKSPLGDGGSGLNARAVREKSEPIIRQHVLHPSLLSPTAATNELTDPSRWSALEAADVMALCDRTVIPAAADLTLQTDWRGVPTSPPTAAVQAATAAAAEAVESSKRSLLFEPNSVTPLDALSPTRHAPPASPDATPPAPLDSSAPTPKPSSPSVSPRRAPSRPPSVPQSRAVSRARSSSIAPSQSSPTSSIGHHRVGTPHMPATTHFANFQALQQSQYQSHSQSQNGSPLGRPRSVSRFRSPISPMEGGGLGEALGWSGILDPRNHSQHQPHQLSHQGVGGVEGIPSGANLSRRSSGVASSLLGGMGSGGPFSPDLVPLGLPGSNSRNLSPPPPTTSVSGQQTFPLSHLPQPVAQLLHAHLTKLETELVLLQGEVAFQTYLKSLHLQHMGTLHREKVLESGAEAERQSSFRTIRTLRAQLRATQSLLDQSRSEQSATKANWIAHISDLREKLATLREQRVGWEVREKRMKAEVEDLEERLEKRGRDIEVGGREFLDLKNQVALDSTKLDKIGEYEHRIQALTKTLAICDADLVKFADQRREMNLLVGEWKKSELLRESVEQEGRKLREALQQTSSALTSLQRSQSLFPSSEIAAEQLGRNAHGASSKDELVRMRKELERLRNRNLELEERLADRLEIEEDDM